MSKRLFSIPRKIHPAAKPYWDIVRKYGSSRMAMVRYLDGISEYSTRHTRYAFSWNVKDYYSDLDVDNLWSIACKEDIRAGHDVTIADSEMGMFEQAFRSAYEKVKESLHENAYADMRDSWDGTDEPYENFSGERIEWEWEFEGRQGGHLCAKNITVKKANGAYASLDMRQDHDDVICLMAERDSGEFVIDTAVVRALFILAVQMSKIADSRAISSEVEYRAADYVYRQAIDEFQELREYRAQRDSLGEDAQRMRAILTSQFTGNDDALIASFDAICKLADVPLAP